MERQTERGNHKPKQQDRQYNDKQKGVITSQNRRIDNTTTNRKRQTISAKHNTENETRISQKNMELTSICDNVNIDPPIGTMYILAPPFIYIVLCKLCS